MPRHIFSSPFVYFLRLQLLRQSALSLAILIDSRAPCASGRRYDSRHRRHSSPAVMSTISAVFCHRRRWRRPSSENAAPRPHTLSRPPATLKPQATPLATLFMPNASPCWARHEPAPFPPLGLSRDMQLHFIAADEYLYSRKAPLKYYAIAASAAGPPSY